MLKQSKTATKNRIKVKESRLASSAKQSLRKEHQQKGLAWKGLQPLSLVHSNSATFNRKFKHLPNLFRIVSKMYSIFTLKLDKILPSAARKWRKKGEIKTYIGIIVHWINKELEYRDILFSSSATKRERKRLSWYTMNRVRGREPYINSFASFFCNLTFTIFVLTIQYTTHSLT